MLSPRARVEAGGCGLFLHGLRGLVEGDQDADLGLFALDHADEIAYMADLHFASLDGDDDLLGGLVALIEEVQAPVDAFVCSLFSFLWAGTDETERPPLELVGVLPGQLRGVLGGRGLSNYLVVGAS